MTFFHNSHLNTSYPRDMPVLFFGQDYISKLKDTSSSGAVFFAVCRGKVCLDSDLIILCLY